MALCGLFRTSSWKGLGTDDRIPIQIFQAFTVQRNQENRLGASRDSAQLYILLVGWVQTEPALLEAKLPASEARE